MRVFNAFLLCFKNSIVPPPLKLLHKKDKKKRGKMPLKCYFKKKALMSAFPVLSTVHKEGSRMEGTLDFDSVNLGANF